MTNTILIHDKAETVSRFNGISYYFEIVQNEAVLFFYRRKFYFFNLFI